MLSLLGLGVGVVIISRKRVEKALTAKLILVGSVGAKGMLV